MGGHRSKTDTAYTEFSYIPSRPATDRTSVIGPYLKLGIFPRFYSKRSFCQFILLIPEYPGCYKIPGFTVAVGVLIRRRTRI
jgi:hypothetical protein